VELYMTVDNLVGDIYKKLNVLVARGASLGSTVAGGGSAAGAAEIKRMFN
jgi:hypothetical protein